MAALSRFAAIRRLRRETRRERADLSQFADLIADPVDLGGVADDASSLDLVLPANAFLAVSFSEPVGEGDLSLSVGPVKVLNTPNLVAGQVYRPWFWGEESQTLTVNRHGAPAGECTVYVVDGSGRPRAIATATFT